MGVFDTIKVDHECPRCLKKLKDYDTRGLVNTLSMFRLGEPLNIGKGPNFEFGLEGDCDSCDILIYGKGVVRKYIFSEIWEVGYLEAPMGDLEKLDKPMTRKERLIAKIG